MRNFARRVSNFLLRDLISKQEEVLAELQRQTSLQRFDLLGEARVVSVPYEGLEVKVYVPYGDVDHIQRDLVVFRHLPEPKTLEFIRKNFDLSGSTVIDAGANIGTFSLFFSVVCGAGKIYAFEPNPLVCNIFRKNMELNNVGSAELFEVALSSSERSMAFNLFDANNLGSTSFRASDEGIIEARTLDSYKFRDVSVIKIDVEGAQMDLIRGAADTLQTSRPAVIMEVFDGEREETFALMKYYGYEPTQRFEHYDYLFER